MCGLYMQPCTAATVVTNSKRELFASLVTESVFTRRTQTVMIFDGFEH